MRIIIIQILLFGLAIADLCKRAGVCCDNSLTNCEGGHGLCLNVGDTCSMTSPGTDCTGTTSIKALSQQSYTLIKDGPGSTGIDFSTLFTNTAGAHCMPSLCQLYKTTSLTAACGTTPSTLTYSIAEADGALSFTTSYTFSKFLCMTCSDASSNPITTNQFKVEVVQGCTASSSITLHPPMPATSFSFSISLNSVPSTPAIPVFTDAGGDSCQVSETKLIKNSANSDPHPDLEIDSGTRQIKLKDASKKHQEQTFTLAIYIIFENGVAKIAADAGGQEDLTFSIACDSSSTNVVISGSQVIDGVTYGADQYSPTGLGGKFLLPPATSSLLQADPTSSCGIISRSTTLSDASPQVLLGVLLDAVSGAYYVKAADDHTAAYHSFAFTATAKGGATGSASLAFHLGCYATTVFSDPNSPGSLSLAVQPASNNMALTPFQPFTSNNPNCAPATFTIEDLEVNSAPASSSLVSIDCASGPPCQVSTTYSESPRSISYKIKGSYPNAQSKLTLAYAVTFACSPAAQAIQLDYPPVLVVTYPQFTSENKIIFGPYSCGIPTCCGALTYTVNDGTSNLVISTETNSSRSFTFNEAVVGTKSYTVSVDDGAGGHSASWVAQITIRDICKVESTFVRNHASLSRVEQAEIESIAGLITYAPNLKVTMKVDISKRTTFQLDLSNQFMSSRCSAVSYRATVESSSATASQAGASAFSITTTGILTFKLSPAFQVNETYSIKIDVFNGHLWSSFADAILILEICEFCDGMHSLPEVAPEFIEPLQQEVRINLGEAANSFTYPLPYVLDRNGDTWQVQLRGDSAVTFDANSNSLVVDLHDKEAGSNVAVDLILIDSKQRSSEYTCTFLLEYPDPAQGGPITLPSPPQQNSADKDDLGQLEGSRLTAEAEVTAQVEDISNLGFLTIEFSERLTSIPSFSPANVDMYVRPSRGRDQEEGFELATVNFTWVKKTSRDDRIVDFELRFDHPLEISPLAVQDEIVIHFGSKIRPLLTSAAGKAPLSPKSWTMTTKITKQMPVNSFTKGFEAGAQTVEVSLKVLLLVTFILNILAKGGLIYMLQMIRSLQIVLHFPLLRIIVPANVNMFFAYLIPIAMFDILDPEWTTELVLNFDEEGQEELSEDILDQMKDLGYETHNSILNMGSLSIFLGAYFLKLALYSCMVLFSKLTGRGQSVVTWLRDGLFFSDILSIVLDAYFEFIISGYLQVQQPLWSFNGEVGAMLIGTTALFLALIGYPAIQAYQLSKTKEECLEPHFEERWGTLTEGISMETKWKRAYFLLFVLRRLLFFALVIGITTNFEFQIFGVLALNVAYFLYIGQATPHASSQLNRIELINEFFIHLGSIALLLFTDWVPDQGLQYHAGGWSHIVLIALMIVGNMYFVLNSFAYRLRLSYLRLKQMINLKKIRKARKRAGDILGDAVESSPSASSSEERKSEQGSDYPLKVSLEISEIWKQPSPETSPPESPLGSSPEKRIKLEPSQPCLDKSISNLSFSEIGIGSSISTKLAPQILSMRLNPQKKKKKKTPKKKTKKKPDLFGLGNDYPKPKPTERFLPVQLGLGPNPSWVKKSLAKKKAKAKRSLSPYKGRVGLSNYLHQIK